MARALSEEKRTSILQTAKRLFAEHGFGTTSVADIARAADIPVGSIYTYFTSKEDLIQSIVEEGWSDFRSRLEEAFAGARNDTDRLRVLVDKFLPELVADVEFIQILLSEGVAYTRMEEKIAELSLILRSIIEPRVSEHPGVRDFSQKDMRAALLVYFLGMLGAVRLSQSADLDITASDVLGFLRRSIRNGLGVEL